MKSLIKYRIKMYKLSNKYIVPLLIFCLYLYVAYRQKPESFVPNMTMSAMVVGIAMMCITFSFFETQDKVSEKILYCNIKHNKFKYYLSDVFSLITISIGLSIFSIVFAYIVNFANVFSFFKENVTIYDYLLAFILHIFMSLIFICTTFLFQSRIFSNRKLAPLFLLLIAILSILKQPIIAKVAILKYIFWILPPANEMYNCFTTTDMMSLYSIGISCLYSLVYSMIVFTIGIIIVNRTDF